MDELEQAFGAYVREQEEDRQRRAREAMSHELPSVAPAAEEPVGAVLARGMEAQQQREHEAALRAMGGEAQPRAHDAVDQLGAVRGARQQEAADWGRALMGQQVVRSPNPMFAPTQELVGDTREALERERVAAQEAAEARELRERRIASEVDSQVRELGTDMAVAKATQRLHVEQQQQEIDAVKAARQQYQDVVQKFASAPEVDPDRYWNDKSAGFKFFAALGAGLMAAGGHGDPLGHIRQAIHSDIESQKVNLGARQARVGMAEREFGMQENVFADVMAQIGDERAAELIIENARWEEAKMRLQQLQQEAGIPVLTAEQQQMLAQMDQQIAQNQYQLEQLAAANPQAFVAVRPSLAGPQREVAGKLFDHQLAREGKAEDALIKQIEATSIEGRGGLSPSEFTGAVREYGKMRKDAELQQRNIQDFLKQYGEGDIPGVDRFRYGLPDHERIIRTDRSANVQQQLEMMFNQYRKMITGAQASEKEIEMLQKAIWGDRTEADVRWALNHMRKAAERELEIAERSHPDPVRKFYNRNEDTLDIAPRADVAGEALPPVGSFQPE